MIVGLRFIELAGVISKTAKTTGLDILVGEVAPPDSNGPTLGFIGQARIQEGVAIQLFIVIGRGIGAAFAFDVNLSEPVLGK